MINQWLTHVWLVRSIKKLLGHSWRQQLPVASVCKQEPRSFTCHPRPRRNWKPTKVQQLTSLASTQTTGQHMQLIRKKCPVLPAAASQSLFQRGRYLKSTNPSYVRAVFPSDFHWGQRDSRAAPERNAPKRYSMWHLRRTSRHPQADGWQQVFHQENWDIMEEWGQKYIHCNCIWKYKGYDIIYPEGTSVQKEDYQKQPGWKKC